MSTDYKALTMRVTDEAWNKGEMDILNEVCSENLLYHDLLMPDINGVENYKKYVLEVRASYPDFHVTVEELIQEGNTVAGKGYWEGTQLGASPGLKISPTGKKIRVNFAEIIHGADGKIVEIWMYQDWLGIMRQLGLLPQQK